MFCPLPAAFGVSRAPPGGGGLVAARPASLTTSRGAACGGAPGTNSRAWRGLFLLDGHGLDGRDDAVLDLDLDHARPDGADRLLEVDLAAVDRDAAGLLDRVDDVLRRDRAEQAAVVARLVRDRQHGAVQRLGGLTRGGRRLGEGALGGLLALGRGGDGALGRRRRDLARDQVVAEVALRDVDDRPAGAELLVVLQEDRFRHLRYLAVAIAAAATTAAFALVAAGALADVRE